MNPPHCRFSRILIVQTAFIGDVILITPLIRAVNDLYPHAKLDVMVVPEAAGLLNNNPYIDRIIRFDKRRSRTSFFQIVKQLRLARYDLVISPHSSFTTHLLLWMSGATVRIGYARGFLSGILMTQQVPHPKGIHKILKNLSLLTPLTNRSFSIQTELFPGPEDEKHADELLSSLLDPDRPLIAIAPGSIWNTKRWPLEYYNQLVKSLLKNGFSIVLIGGESDRSQCDHLLKDNHPANSVTQIINTAGKSNLLTSSAILKSAKLLICNDSGALHMANAVKTKVFAFFGPTVKRIGYYPYQPEDHVFEVDLDCRPCGSHGGNRCPLGHHNCMNKIMPEEVLIKVLKTLDPEEIGQ